MAGSHERVKRESTSQEELGLGPLDKRSSIQEELELDISKVHKKKSRATLLLHEDEVPKRGTNKD